mgnify:CR=1 FL=1
MQRLRRLLLWLSLFIRIITIRIGGEVIVRITIDKIRIDTYIVIKKLNKINLK